MMRIVTGDEAGLVKVFSANPDQSRIATDPKSDAKNSAETIKPFIWGRVDRESSIEALATVESNEDQIWIARKGGRLSCLDRTSSELLHEINFGWNDKTISFAGLQSTKSHLGVANSAGRVEFLPLDELEKVEREVFQIGDHLSKMRIHRQHDNLFACGGKENDLSLYDLASGKKEPIFKAKNVKNNSLDLRVPVWVTDLQFANESPHEIAVGTKYHHMRMYDTRTARRPVISVEVGESPIRSMCMIPNTRQALFSDTLGNLSIFDYSAQKVIGGFKGFSGAVVDIQCHPMMSDHVVSVSVDRFLRIHDLNSRKMTQKIYLKQKLSCVVLAHEQQTAGDDDEIWNQMETQVGLENVEKKKSVQVLDKLKKKKRVKTQ